MKPWVTVHATATPSSQSPTRRDIDLRDRRSGMLRIGYHYLIGREGQIEVGRQETENSPHDPSEINRQSISVCLIGGVNEQGKPEDNFTLAQRAALVALTKDKQVKVMTDSLNEAVVLSWKEG